MTSLTGRNIGKYRIMERLGRGGMADVYKGYHPRLERYVALKVLHPHLIEGEDFLKRFEREAKTVAALRHPNIVQVFDFDVEDDIYYMVMEFIDGGSLKEKLRNLAGDNKFLPQEEVNHIFKQVANALGYAHKRGMLHRDVKPSNILLDESGKAYLTDFGIAKIMSGSTQLTATGTLIGTPAYMSPEQCKGIDASTPSDIYSLGVVLYELVVGNVPFDADTPLAVLHKHLYEPLPLPSASRNDMSDSMERVILKALAKEPEDRFQNAFEMLDAFNAALEKEPINNGTSRYRETPGPLVDNENIDEDIEAVETVAMEAFIEPDQKATQENISSPQKTTKPKIKGKKFLFVSIGTIIILALAIIFLIIPNIQRITDFISDQPQQAQVEEIQSGDEEMPPDEPLCPTIDECLQQAREFRSTDEFDPSIEHYFFALSLVPEEEHPPFANIFCEMAEYALEKDNLQFALDHFHICIEWTEEDPGLQELRDFAMENINHIEELMQQPEQQR